MIIIPPARARHGRASSSRSPFWQPGKAAGIVAAYTDTADILAVRENDRFDWEDRCLVFNVREPFISKTSGAEIVSGTIDAKTPLAIVSHMPQNGVIFSDGVEEDRLDFNSGAIAAIGLGERTLRLVVLERTTS